MLGTARDVDPAATQVDEKEDVESGREYGVDGKEVACEHARRLAADELAPGDAGSLASGSEACFAQELADRRRRDAEAERAEFARDPLVAPAAVFACQPEDQLADLIADRRSPGQERPVDGPKRGPRNLAPQDGELMTENDDLQLLEVLGAASERDELKQACKAT